MTVRRVAASTKGMKVNLNLGMPRRARKKHALLIAPVALAALVMLAPAGGAANETATSRGEVRPNILLITTDDQTRADMKYLPLTRRLLGDAGVTFTNMLSPHPLCCPARAEILTGQFAQNNGVLTNAGVFGGFSALRKKDNTIATWLHDAGYETSLAGKFLNGFKPDARPGATEQTALGDRVQPGWDHWFSYAGDRAGYTEFAMYDGTYPVQQHDNDGTYATTSITDDAVKQIHAFSVTPQPFFMWTSYYAPHGVCAGPGEGCMDPPVPAPQDSALWTDVPNPAASKPSFNEPDVSDKPYAIRHLRKVDPDLAQKLFTKRIQALASVDRGVAAQVAALDATGQLDNTLILFTSDNGFLLGEHRYLGKVFPYEEALRVPLLVRGPGLPAGVQRSANALTIDLAPTIVAAAHVAAGRVMDGHDLRPYIDDPDRRPTRTTLIQAGNVTTDPTDRKWTYRGVRTGRYTLARWTPTKGDPTGFYELYDRVRDPFQLRNLAYRRDYFHVRSALMDRLKALVTCAGAECEQSFPHLPAVGSTTGR